MAFARFMGKYKSMLKVRLLVASWPEDAPRGAIERFCREHQVSRSWFHKVLKQSRSNGQWEAMKLGSTRPKTSPLATPEEMVRLVLAVRAELEGLGHDHGPLSVQSKLRRRGLQPPSRATIARVFTRAGVIVPQPQKRPRSSFIRFVYPAPNCLWQIDATEWQLTRGRKATIFQLMDDHSRLALASLTATGETSEAAVRIVKLAIERHGVPRKFLSDNGVALNPSRRGAQGKLVRFLKSLGVEPITGKPGKPTTQGKNERFHQTMLNYLKKQPLAETLAELQAQVDTFDAYYNTEREHQGLEPGTTPQEAWDATPVADPPLPPPPPVPAWESAQRRTNNKGATVVFGIKYMLGKRHAHQSIHILYNHAEISFFDARGTEIISHPWPPKKTKYVGNDRPRGFMAKYEVSTKS